MENTVDFLKGLLMDDGNSENWVMWKHIMQGKTHCPDCLVMDRCWFAERNSPPKRLHDYCHCIKIPIPYDWVLDYAEAVSAYSKFDPFLFDVNGKYKHGKNIMFESWGYTVDDSAWLQKELEEQAIYKYISGDYALGKLDKNGQRIDIRIDLDRKDKPGSVSFISGWMVKPDGKIRLNTPYGGQ